MTAERNIIYVASPPRVDPAADFIRGWTRSSVLDEEPVVNTPRVEDLVDYLSAFYHGLEVKLLPPSMLEFTIWDSGPRPSKTRISPSSIQYVALKAESSGTRIRVRRTAKGHYPYQMNLNDLLDAAIDMLPSDAYALLLLVEHDLFEDEEDEFVCGRAYGGSRVAVVSSARYHPGLDAMHHVERQHAWPASHCRDYVQRCCNTGNHAQAKKARQNAKGQKPVDTDNVQSTHTSPIHSALQAHVSLPSLITLSSATAAALYLSRLSRTAAHELGHCLGIDHCVYYACSMQGSASLAEDARQPPYLCPVDDAKVSAACGVQEKERCVKLREFCNRWEDGALFSAFGAWLEERIIQLDGDSS